MSVKKKTTQVVENPVVVAIKDAVTALREAITTAVADKLCPDSVSTRLANLKDSVSRTATNAEKRMETATKKAARAEKAEATKGERKQKLIEKIAALQKKADAIS